MKLVNLFLLFLCFVEIYGQRSRTTSSNQDVSTQAPKTVRGRGRARFSETQDSPQTSERPTSNRRASTRTRIHSNNPKAAADRRSRPTEAPSRGYAVEEINNESPIDSFRRQSKSRILTESRFEIPTITVPRRAHTFESARASPVPSPNEEISFGSTARAILQARGETLSPKTTTPIVDEAYLLNNFGTTIRSIAALRNEVPIQRATPLRSEVPILDREDIPSRRSSLRGDPLPSLRGSDISVERQLPSRGRKKIKVKPIIEQTRSDSRFENQKKAVEPTIVEETERLEPENDAPESVQGIFEQETVTETQPFEASSESVLVDDEDLRKTSSAEVVTQRITEPLEPRKTVVNNRRSGARGRAEAASEYQPSAALRTRAPKTRTYQRSEEANTVSPTRTRGARRRYEDAAVAESRSRGPSVFTADQYQEVTSRSRTGRRIDSRFESVPERIPIGLPPSTTVRSKSSGRRATTVRPTSTERSSLRDKNNSRGRSRSRGNEESTSSPVSRLRAYEESTSAPVSKPSNSRRSSLIDDTAVYGDKTNNIQTENNRRETSIRTDIAEPKSESRQTTGSRRETSSRFDSTEPRAAVSRVKSVETSPNRRGSGRSDARSNGRAPTVNSRRETANSIESTESSRYSDYRQSNEFDEEISFGEKSIRTNTQPLETTTTTEEPTTILNLRSKSRFLETPPKIDESKLEVLPLFERDTKTVPSSRTRGQRTRSSVNRRQNAQDHMHVSATENDVKFVEKPTTNAFTRVTVTRTESVEASTSRTRLSTRTSSTTASTTVADTTRKPTSTTTIRTTTIPETTSTTKKWVTRAPPLIRESVVAEVNEVTSKSTMRRKKVSKAKAAEVLSRGSKKAEVKLTDVGAKKASSEEIDEEDNYPEPFKALIQAKKKQEEPRPSPSSARSTAPAIKITSTEKVFVTSVASPPRGSSTARVVTTASPSPEKRLQLVNEIINDNENELDPKPTITSTPSVAPTRPARFRQLPKFSEKPKYTQKPREKYTKSATDKPRFSSEKGATKTTATPRKSYTPKSFSTRDPVEHHSRRKALRSTAFPPSTTPMNLVNREAKYSAKFVRKETRSLESDSKNLKNSGTQYSKGLYTSKKRTEKDSEEEGGKAGRKLDGSIIQTPKPSLPIKKFNSSRYSSRYRGDPSQRSTVLRTTTTAPFYIPTIPTPAYVPTVPTIAPPITPEYMVWSDHRPFDYTWYYVK